MIYVPQFVSVLSLVLTYLSPFRIREHTEEEESQPLFDSEDPNTELEKENAPAISSKDKNCDGSAGGKAAETHLWVEKYSPKRFTELLSDDVCV